MKHWIIELEKIWRPQILDKIVFWDFMKMKIREFARKFSQEKAKRRKDQIEILEEEIKNLEKHLVNTPLKTVSDEIQIKKKELENLYDYSRQGLKVRSRAGWYEEGEKNMLYFTQLLESNKR